MWPFRRRPRDPYVAVARYSPEAAEFARQHGMKEPNIFVPSPSAPPYYPESIREFLLGEPKHTEPAEDLEG